MPYKKVIVGPKYAVRLEDMKASDALFAGFAWLRGGRARPVAALRRAPRQEETPEPPAVPLLKSGAPLVH